MFDRSVLAVSCEAPPSRPTLRPCRRHRDLEHLSGEGLAQVRHSPTGQPGSADPGRRPHRMAPLSAPHRATCPSTSTSEASRADPGWMLALTSDADCRLAEALGAVAAHAAQAIDPLVAGVAGQRSAEQASGLVGVTLYVNGDERLLNGVVDLRRQQSVRVIASWQTVRPIGFPDRPPPPHRPPRATASGSRGRWRHAKRPPRRPTTG